MSFKNVKKGKSDLIVRFDLSGVNAATANALRRSMYALIKTYAICTSTLIKNDTNLPDEYLAHRLTLVPLDYHFLAKLDEEGEPLPTLTLNKTNESERDLERVYLSDFEAEGANIKDVVVYPETLFAILKPGEALEVKSVISTGTQYQYASVFSPVCCAAYEIVEKKEKPVKSIDQTFKYEVESVGQIPVVEVVDLSFAVLQERLQNIIVALETNDPQVIEIEKIAIDENIYILPTEDYTIGNLLTTYLQEELNLVAAYETGHPLTPALRIRLRSTDNENVFKRSIETALNRLADLQKKWGIASAKLK